jgi:hypothetical protein
MRSQCDQPILVTGKEVAVDFDEAGHYGELQTFVIRR